MNWKKIIAFREGKDEVGQVSAAVVNNVAHFSIVGRIWSWSADEDSLIRREIDNAINAGIKSAVIEGSSEGGSVFATNDLLALFQKFDDVKIKVHALMASAFTYLTSNFHTTIKANTQGMIHKPILSVNGNIDELESVLKLGKNITEDYAKAYAKKTGKTIDQIRALWASGDYWMNAQELLDEGFVDAIEGEVEAFTERDVMALSACGAPIIPKVTKKAKNNNKSKTPIMDREELIAFLGLSADATDDQIKSAREAMKVDALKLRSQAADNEKKSQTEAKQKAEALVDSAIVNKKITADQKEAYLELAEANYDATEKILSAMHSREKLSGNLDLGKSDDASRAKWTLEDYLEKDPDAYEKLKVENPKQAEALEAAYFTQK